MKIQSALIMSIAALFALPAFADEDMQASTFTVPGSALDKALELGLGLGYSQGLGDIGANQPGLNDISHGGGEVTVHVGYRLNPNLLLGAYGSVGTYTTGNLTPASSNVWSSTAGIEANYHFLPGSSFDPWVGLGAGWRGHWVVMPSGTDSRHGIDFARVTVGLDFKVTPNVFVSPYIGASGTVFLTQELQNEQSFSNIGSPNANLFVYSGVMGRFDILGGSSSAMSLASN